MMFVHLSIFHITHISWEGTSIECFCQFLCAGQGPDHGPTLHHTQGVIHVVLILMIFTEASQEHLK